MISLRDKRNKHVLISTGILFFLVIFILSLLLIPLYGQFNRYSVELVKDGRVVQNLMTISASRKEILNATSEYDSRNLGAWIYSDVSINSIELDIQRSVTNILSDAGVKLQTIAPIQGQFLDGYRSVGVRILFRGGLSDVLHVFESLGNARPIMIMDDVRIVPIPSGREGAEINPQSLEVNLTVLTFVSAVPEMNDK